MKKNELNQNLFLGQGCKIRSTCRSCKAQTLLTRMNFGNLPLAGKFPNTKEESLNMQRFPLTLVECCRCHLVQIKEVVDPSLLFEDYNYTSSSSPGLVQHFKDYAEGIKRANPFGGLIIDIGCNDGILLNQLQDYGYSLLGIDPSNIALEAAKKNKFNLYNTFLTPELAQEIKDYYGSPALVTGSNVFAHIDDMDNILKAVNILQPSYFALEVHYLKELVNQMQYDFIYHEHLNYYSLKSIDNMLKQYNFGIGNIQFTNMHNGSLRIEAQSNLSKSPYINDLINNEEIDMYNFSQNIDKCIKSIYNFVNNYQGKLVCYGASARGSMLLNMSNATNIAYVVDNSSSRAEKFIPGLGIPTYYPNQLLIDKPDGILVTAWNYFDSIVQQIKDMGLKDIDIWKPLPILEKVRI